MSRQTSRRATSDRSPFIGLLRFCPNVLRTTIDKTRGIQRGVLCHFAYKSARHHSVTGVLGRRARHEALSYGLSRTCSRNAKEAESIRDTLVRWRHRAGRNPTVRPSDSLTEWHDAASGIFPDPHKVSPRTLERVESGCVDVRAGSLPTT
ncbi:hypothetical protein BDV12DRAFT_155656 [Aspergillus spectabilis]